MIMIRIISKPVVKLWFTTFFTIIGDQQDLKMFIDLVIYPLFNPIYSYNFAQFLGWTTISTILKILAQYSQIRNNLR